MREQRCSSSILTPGTHRGTRLSKGPSAGGFEGRRGVSVAPRGVAAHGGVMPQGNNTTAGVSPANQQEPSEED